MQGISFEELYEYVSNSHDIEFTYNKTNYVLQTEVGDKGYYLVIWNCNQKKPHCIVKYEIPNINLMPKLTIDKILNTRCFDGKSFMEIEDSIVVDIIY